jgi:hypothetical protein
MHSEEETGGKRGMHMIAVQSSPLASCRAHSRAAKAEGGQIERWHLPLQHKTGL